MLKFELLLLVGGREKRQKTAPCFKGINYTKIVVYRNIASNLKVPLLVKRRNYLAVKKNLVRKGAGNEAKNIPIFMV